MTIFGDTDNDGQGQGQPEAVYTNQLIVESGATLGASEITVYYTTGDNQGMVENPEQPDQVVLFSGTTTPTVTWT